ncbi:MAG: hypothetical protein HIU92_13985 [Proteobacteria bacterium]|nr:hypothetical protein [Pseudomonadota bacterium]
MARIRKDDHPRILALVDVERTPVREIATEYGCTPAAIYALLTKLRREAAGAQPGPGESQPPLALDDAAEPLPEPRLAEPVPPLGPPPAPEDERWVVALARVAATAAPVSPIAQPIVQEAVARPQPGRPEPWAQPARPEAKLGAKLAKPGMGLVMRTADGEESMTPFRSVDDLLSAIKPLLRASARSPEPVWFSLQPVDLSSIDADAA